MADSPDSSDLRIRLAGEADIARLAPLLPLGLSAPNQTRYLVAESGPGGEFAGGAWLSFQRDRQGRHVGHLKIAVPDAARLKEVGSMLLRGCAVQARQGRVSALQYSGMVNETDPLCDLLGEHGFAISRAHTEYIMDAHSMLKACNSAYRWVERKGGIPEDGRAIALRDAPVTPVRQLIRRYLGAMPSLQWWRPGSDILADISTVVMVGPRVVAAIVVRDVDGQAESPFDVVEEGYRRGWVTIALWRRTVQKGIEAGYGTARFVTSEEEFREFANFARRMKAEPLGRKLAFRRNLAIAPESAPPADGE